MPEVAHCAGNPLATQLLVTRIEYSLQSRVSAIVECLKWQMSV